MVGRSHRTPARSSGAIILATRNVLAMMPMSSSGLVPNRYSGIVPVQRILSAARREGAGHIGPRPVARSHAAILPSGRRKGRSAVTRLRPSAPLVEDHGVTSSTCQHRIGSSLEESRVKQAASED
ncbi:hypothetical protein ABIA39_001143 [Nocardia sp. GAS34]